jgi:nucleoside-diphosphate-sugar epimerase
MKIGKKHVKVFVTGATGLVGSHLLLELLASGYEVRAVKRANSNINRVLELFELYNDNAFNLFKRIEWVETELTNYSSVYEDIADCQCVYHTAANVSFNKSDKAQMMHFNVCSTAHIVNACNEKQIPLCHVSSIAALGRGQDGAPITEDDIWQTTSRRSAYSISKYNSEMEVWRGIAEGLNAVIVNPSVIFGVSDWAKGSAKFFSTIYKRTLFYTNGMTGFVDVKDVCNCMIRLMEEKHFGQRYIISADNMTFMQIFNMIADKLNVRRPPLSAPVFVLNMVAVISEIISTLTHCKPTITRETARSAFQKIKYSNEKITKLLDYEFIPIEKTIEECSKTFLLENNKNISE